MTGKIHLRCECCGNALVVSRDITDPTTAVEMVTNYCDICDDGGGFMDEWYFDRDGQELRPT